MSLFKIKLSYGWLKISVIQFWSILIVYDVTSILKSQESISLACFQLMNWTFQRLPSNKSHYA